jgi:hypothetical protein
MVIIVSPGRIDGSVRLFLFIAYTTENIRRHFLGGENLQSADNRIDKYLRNTTTDADGRFSITGVPTVDYYLESEITWSTQFLQTDEDGRQYYMYSDHQKLVFVQLFQTFSRSACICISSSWRVKPPGVVLVEAIQVGSAMA